MKNKIGLKIFMYILILIVITFSVFVFSFLNQIEKYFEKEIQEDFTRTGNYVVELFTSVERVNNKAARVKDLLYEFSLSNITYMGRTIESSVVIFDEEGKLIFPKKLVEQQGDIRKVTLDRVITRAQDQIENGEVIGKVMMLKVKNTGEQLGTIIMTTPNSDLKLLTQDIRRRAMISMGIAVLVASIIALYIQRKIAKPIVALRNAMSDYELDGESLPVIKTGDEIEDLYVAFKELGDKLTGYNERQKIFFQNSSHELKSPLMSIQGYAEAIKDGIVEGDEKDESLDIIIRESQRLKTTVDEIIFMSKLDQSMDEYYVVAFDLGNMVKEILEELKPQAMEKEVLLSLNVEHEILFNGDKRQMKRAIGNIINNGIRYAKSRIDININDNEQKIYMDIIDDGPGFKIGEEDQVFDRFYKGEKGNSGIGLAMVKSIIERHGGEITAINNINFGAIFKLKLDKGI